MDTNQLDNLLPCPFCDKPFEIVVYPDDGTAYWKHNSPDCPMHRESENGYLYCNEDGLVEELNRRPIEDAMRSELEDAKAKIAAREWPFNNQLSDYSTAAINATLTAQNETIKTLRAEVARLTAALEWYADARHYDGDGSAYTRTEAGRVLDFGTRARRALGRE